MFTTAPERVRCTRDVETLEGWLAEQAASTRRIPMEGPATVEGDRIVSYAGEGRWTVTRRGLGALCREAGVGRTLVEAVREEGLGSWLLQERLDAASRRRRARRRPPAELVVDTDAGAILGVVGKGYATLTNQALLAALAEEAAPGERMQWAWLDGTELRLRYGDERKTFAFAKVGDEAWAGVEARNSMVGRSAVHIDHFVERLVCLNGMVMRIREGGIRIVHVGGEDRLRTQIAEAVAEVAAERATVQAQVQALAAIPWTAEATEGMAGWPAVREALPEALRGGAPEARGADDEPPAEACRRALAAEQGRITTACDWINALTATARELAAAPRHGLETAAGRHATEWAAAAA